MYKNEFFLGAEKSGPETPSDDSENKEATTHLEATSTDQLLKKLEIESDPKRKQELIKKIKGTFKKTLLALTAFMAISSSASAEENGSHAILTPDENGIHNIHSEQFNDKNYQIICSGIEEIIRIQPELGLISADGLYGVTTDVTLVDSVITKGSDGNDYLVHNYNVMVGNFYRDIKSSGDEITKTTTRTGPVIKKAQVSLASTLSKNAEDQRVLQMVVFFGGNDCSLIEFNHDQEPIQVTKLNSDSTEQLDPALYDFHDENQDKKENNPDSVGNF